MNNEFFSIEKISEDLNYGYMSISDYYEALESNILRKRLPTEDDFMFQCNCPQHPLNSDHRFKRMDAADALLRMVKNNEFDQDNLYIINEHIFDCCAAVRLALVTALIYVGDITSVKEIEDLIALEEESKSVKNMSELALDKIVNNKDYIVTSNELYIGDIIDNQANGIGKMYNDYVGSLIYEGAFKSNRFHGEGIYYNDDGTVRYKGVFRDGKFIG